MSSNNYYGYNHNHSGSQYQNQANQQYNQANYTNAQAAQYVPAQAAVNSAPAFATQTTAQAQVAPTGYSFAQRPQVVQASPTYDNRSKTFYTATSLPASVFTQQTNNSRYQNYVPANNVDKNIGSQARSSSTVQPSLQNVAYQTNLMTSKSPYDQAVYHAAANYHKQNPLTPSAPASALGAPMGTNGTSAATANPASVPVNTNNNVGNNNHHHSGVGGQRNHGQSWGRNNYKNRNSVNKPPTTMHYCEVCKVSCAGPMTYKEHLNGNKHTKKAASNARLQEQAALAAASSTNSNSSSTTPTTAASAPSKPKGGGAKYGSAKPHQRYRCTNQALAQLKCILCEIVCTGVDAYASHVRGIKHQKVLKLHTKMGKEIPEEGPQVLDRSGNAIEDETMRNLAIAKINDHIERNNVVSKDGKVIGSPKISFVSGTTLHSIKPESKGSDAYNVAAPTTPTTPPPFSIGTRSQSSSVNHNVKIEQVTPSKTASTSASGDFAASSSSPCPSSSSVSVDPALTSTPAAASSDDLDLHEVKPVGEEYLQTICNDLGVAISFRCTLCDCKFNDPNARLMHTKGRRHRQSYKKRVDPSLFVEIKPSDLNDRRKNKRQGEITPKKRDPNLSFKMNYMNYHIPGPDVNISNVRDMEAFEDKHVLLKHTALLPSEEEIADIKKLAKTCEVALKHVSTQIHNITVNVPAPVEEEEEAEATSECLSPSLAGTSLVSTEGQEEEEEEGEFEEEIVYEADDLDCDLKSPILPKKVEEPKIIPPTDKIVKGVVRIGCLQKDLMLRGESEFQLVVMCSIKPTQHLLNLVHQELPRQLAALDKESNYVLTKLESSIVVCTSSETFGDIKCHIYLTSPTMRSDEAMETPAHVMPGEPDRSALLSVHHCRQLLAQLRHNKWFKAKVTSKPYLVIMRIMKDLCSRAKRWKTFSKWAMELLIRNVLSGPYVHLSPGHALRRVFECLASGILLPGGPGIKDPCEVDNVNAVANLTQQECEDITASAQHALRICAFNKIHLVLGIERIEETSANTREGNASSNTTDAALPNTNDGSPETTPTTQENADNDQSDETLEGEISRKRQLPNDLKDNEQRGEVKEQKMGL